MSSSTDQCSSRGTGYYNLAEIKYDQNSRLDDRFEDMQMADMEMIDLVK